MASREFGPRGFIQVPPDSTGKVMGTIITVVVQYSGGTQDGFTVGDEIVGQTSATFGTVTSILTGSTSSAGEISANVSSESPSSSFVVGENILVGGIVIAQVVSLEGIHTQSMTLVGGNGTTNHQFVDRRGNAYVRFEEGPQQLDAFGASRVTESNQLASYLHYYDELPEDYDTITEGTASVTHLPNLSAFAMDIGTAPGDKVIRTTHRYHHYQPGFGQFVTFTGFLGDNGKTGVRRRIGYFDENDGVFLEVVDDKLFAVIRSSTSGVPVDNRVQNINWNGDRLSGSGGLNNISGDTLILSFMNIYWIDIQWLGAGKVRFGTYAPSTGERIVMHTFFNNNKYPAPFMKRPNLPVRYEQENLSTTSSPSRLTIVCAQVATEGNLVPSRIKKATKTSVDVENKEASWEDKTPLVSFRSKEHYNFQKNRIVAIPELLAVSTDQPIVLSIAEDCSLNSPSWITVSGTSLEWDKLSTECSGGEQLVSWTLPAGQKNLEFPSNFDIYSKNLSTTATGTALNTFSFVAKSLTSGTNATVSLYPTWVEIF